MYVIKYIITYLELCVPPCLETYYEIKKDSVNLELDDSDK